MSDSLPARPRFISRDIVRLIDSAAISELGIPGIILMENAARGVCEVLLSLNPDGRILILCGPGNNGGDGLCLARLLAANGRSSRVHLLHHGRRLSPDAAANLSFLRKSGCSVEDDQYELLQEELSHLSERDWIVDCLFGTGLNEEPRSPWRDVILAANHSPGRILAVDTPSGLNCDTGAASRVCIRAAKTVTFVGMKAGFRNPESRRFTGDISVCHIGLPLSWINEHFSDRFLSE